MDMKPEDVFREIQTLQDPNVVMVLMWFADCVFKKISNLEVEVDTWQNRFYDLQSERLNI